MLMKNMDKINILEFGTYFAGPLVGKYMTDFGCNVTSIIRPESSRGKSNENQKDCGLLHVGKKRIELDLKKQIDDVKTLISESDIIVENFAPNVMKNLGFGFEKCKKINPEILYVSLPGFASGDEEFKDVKAFESIILAASGVFSDNGLNKILRGIDASFTQMPIASVYGSIFASFAIVCAIIGERKGEYLEIPLASALSECMIHNTIRFPKDECYMNMREKQIKSGRYPINDKELQTLFDPFFNVYTCKDDRPFYLVCPAHPRHQHNALKALGIHINIPQVNTYEEGYPLNGLGCGNMSFVNATYIRPLLQQAFKKKDAKEWEIIMGRESVPGIAIRTCEEWKTDPHTIESGLVCEENLANIGWLTDPKPCVDYTPPDKSGSFNLSGYRILDLSNVIAGPTIGKMMAQMGATVIKVDPPNPAYAPEVSVIYGLATNIGKKSILLDIYSEEGRKVLDLLLKDCDAVIVNCTNDCLVRMKLTREDIALVNPNTILMQFDAFSGPNENCGHLHNHVGYDDCIQAAIGIMSRCGGGLNTPEEFANIGTIDVIAGVAGAVIVAVALLERNVYKKVYTARTSLAAVGQYIQFPQMILGEYESCGGMGNWCKGEHELHRCYKAANQQWFVIVASFDKHDKHVKKQMYEEFGVIHENMFDNFEVNDVCKRLEKIGIQSHPLRSTVSLRKLNRVLKMNDKQTYQFLYIEKHPIGCLEIVAPVAIRGCGIDMNLVNAPKYGKHTLSILKILDKSLVSNGISCSWSNNYIPFSAVCNHCNTNGQHKCILSCDHIVCCKCITEDKCPICGIEHAIEDDIRKRISNIRTGYNNWRMGNSKGCRDLEYVHLPERVMRHSHSCPAFIYC